MSCTKGKEVHPEIGNGNDEIVTVGVKDVHVEYTRTDHVELSKVVFHYCPIDANGNAQQFESANMTKKDAFFELTLDNLLSDTLYWYYYELFSNVGDAFNTIQKTFHTQAFEQPEPPTPPTPPSGVPEGAINGLFTINENGDQVYFSQGNLQYQASTNTWRFAEHQWDFVGSTVTAYGQPGGIVDGSSNHLISETYDGWIDMFGWGTSGYNHGASAYQPWSTSTNNSDYYAYGSASNNLFDYSGQADWGYNAISNGGNNENNGWYTLTKPEWEFVFFTRNTASGIRVVKAIVNGISGIVLLPDNWTSSLYSLNDGLYLFNSNIISAIDWTDIFEANGAVFLPAAGSRLEAYIYNVGIGGMYWSASYGDNGSVHYVDFGVYSLELKNGNYRHFGSTVRLVRNANQ